MYLYSPKADNVACQIERATVHRVVVVAPKPNVVVVASDRDGGEDGDHVA